MFSSLILVFISSIFLILSFPKPEISWLVWFSFVSFLFSIEKKNRRQAFWLSYLCGLFFFTGTIYWVNFVTVLGYIFLIIYLSLYFGLFGLCFTFIRKLQDKNTNKIFYFLYNLSIPCFWVSLEFIRSHFFTGFGWGLLGYTQYKNLPLIQIADITGTYGVSFIIMFINVSIFYIIKLILKIRSLILEDRGQRRELKPVVFSSIFYFLFSVLCIVGILFYGQHKINYVDSIEKDLVKVSVIQGNFPAQEKWTSDLKYKILDKYLNLTYKASLDNPGLIVWPETAIPDYINKNVQMEYVIAQSVDSINIPVLIGTPWEENSEYYNSAVFFSKEGEIEKRYDKIHLVPFGEYFPFSKYFPFVFDIFESGNFSPGDDFTVFKLDKTSGRKEVKFSTLICYEDIFPNLVRKFINNGSNFIINITEDSWFGKTGATYQHTQSLVFRSVENCVSSVRAANTGLSCFISPVGRIYGRVINDEGEELFISGYSTENIEISNIDTFYQKYGNIFAYICIFVFFGGVLYFNFIKN